MHVLVMGGTRFNGLALVNELVQYNHHVTVFNRGNTVAQLPSSVVRLYGDRSNDEALRAALGNKHFDCVIDFSAYTPDDVRSVVELVEGRCGHYIFASSTVIYAATNIYPITETFPLQRHQTPYGYNKIACEEYLLHRASDSRFPVTIVPFSMVYGPHNFLPDREQRMIMRLLNKRPILIPGSGITLNQFVHVEDLAFGLRMLMGNQSSFGMRVNLSGKDYYTDEAYVDLHAEALGVVPEKVFVPASVMDALWQEIPRHDSGSERGGAYQAPAAGAVRVTGLSGIFSINRLAPFIHRWDANVVFSIDRLRALTGWEPRYTTPSAIVQTCDWFRSSGLEGILSFDFGAEDRLLRELSQ